MGISDSLEGLGVDSSFFSNIGAKAGDFMFYFIIFLVIATIVGIGFYFLYQKKIYNKTLVIFEEVNGRAVQTQQLKGRETTIPKTTIQVLQLKSGQVLPKPVLKMGKDSYLFFIRDDGEWINFEFTNLNKELVKLDIKYNHVDMRYANSSLKELIKENHGSKDFWSQYGAWVIMGGFVILIGIAFYLGAKELADASALNAETGRVVGLAIDKLTDEIKTSGLRVAP